ncbi:PKD domain-containing protein [Myroides sp. LoEW2-1]|uniref:PKD domain-containing protein n=1 Tax=Myroides sp. LoEW2-1 TaxID=2683192 RepID=UPI001326F2E0|nr:PKD domain-containing protein [Myroides sp. LoEW2-1]MVX37323.1 PKD domain-containing protein [Myroides sp. LoEW2-1]
MRSLLGYVLCLLCMVFYSCYNETTEQIQAEFDYQFENSDQSIPVVVQFINRSSGGDTYKWEFEGGTPSVSTAKDPEKISYLKHGKYAVKLTVTNVDGEVNTTSKIINVLDQISGDFTYSIKGSNYPPVQVTLSNEIKGEGFTYSWIFKGNEVDSFEGKTPPELIYNKPGTYDLVLLVSNGQDTVRKLVNRQQKVDN